MPNSRCRSSIRSRICAWMVTSSAVVGSSAISSVGVVDERHRDHHPLAHAAGELVRVVVDPASRRAGCRPGRASRSRAARASRLGHVGGGAGTPRRSGCRREVRVERGQRILEDHRDLRRRGCLRSSLVGHGRARSSPPSTDLAATCGRAARVQAHDREAGDALAGAGLADDRRASCPAPRGTRRRRPPGRRRPRCGSACAGCGRRERQVSPAGSGGRSRRTGCPPGG